LPGLPRRVAAVLIMAVVGAFVLSRIPGVISYKSASGGAGVVLSPIQATATPAASGGLAAAAMASIGGIVPNDEVTSARARPVLSGSMSSCRSGSVCRLFRGVVMVEGSCDDDTLPRCEW